MKPIHIVGLGLGPMDITPESERIVRRADVIAGGKRLLAFFPDHEGERLVLTGDVNGWLARVAAAAQDREVAVLASGDPGFYGIASRGAEYFGPENIVVHPAVTAAQAAFARLKLPWQDAEIISLHGRGEASLWGALSQYSKIAVYTDPVHSPDVIARKIMERDLENWRLFVLSDLGSPDEQCEEYSLETAARTQFSPLNVVVLIRDHPPCPITVGAPEEAYQHEAGLITKAEVRAVALGKLALSPGHTLWDLGAGCGSVGIEASGLVKNSQVWAVEKKPERVRQIRDNRRKFGAANLNVLQADLPGGIDELPDPDRIFIGGGGDSLADVIKVSAPRLSAGGVMVVSVVMFKSLEAARKTMSDLGMDPEIIQIQINGSKSIAEDLFLRAQNPVWLITGRKTESANI